jgi:hypothetical protein
MCHVLPCFSDTAAALYDIERHCMGDFPVSNLTAKSAKIIIGFFVDYCKISM